MPTDLTIILDNRPGTIAAVGEALGGAAGRRPGRQRRLLYLATATRVVLGGDDVEGIRGAI